MRFDLTQDSCRDRAYSDSKLQSAADRSRMDIRCEEDEGGEMENGNQDEDRKDNPTISSPTIQTERTNIRWSP